MPTVDWRSESAQEQLRIATVEWLWDGLIRGQVVERGYLIFGEGLADDFREAVDARQSTVDEVASLILGLGDAELAEVGLAGTELRLKLGGFRRAMDRAAGRCPLRVLVEA